MPLRKHPTHRVGPERREDRHARLDLKIAAFFVADTSMSCFTFGCSTLALDRTVDNALFARF
jgi:hypothetical protein